MTIIRKYAFSYIVGMAFWAVIFYYVGHGLLDWGLLPLGIAYFILAIILGVSQVAGYRSENIIGLRSRLRRRALITAGAWVAMGIGVLAWLAFQRVMTWELAVALFGAGVAAGFVSLWTSYKVVIKWRLGSRPGDETR